MKDRDLFLSIANRAGMKRKQAEEQRLETTQTQKTDRSKVLFAVVATLCNGVVLYGLLVFACVIF